MNMFQRNIDLNDYLRKLKIDVDYCFAKKINPNYKSYLKNLKTSYVDVGISITPNMHITFEYVSEF